MPVIIDKLLRLGEGKIVRRLETVAAAVNAIEDDFVAMSDTELQGMTNEADGDSSGTTDLLEFLSMSAW